MPRGGESRYRRELPFRGRLLSKEGYKSRGCQERDAPGLIAVSQPYFSSGEHSVQGKAGALWETTFPLLHPLPSPRSTPSWWFRYSPHSDSARPLGKAARLGSGRLVLLRDAKATRTDSKGVPRQNALTRGAFFDRHVSGGRASKSYVQIRRAWPSRCPFGYPHSGPGLHVLWPRAVFRETARLFTASAFARRSVLPKHFSRKQNNVQAAP